MYGLVLEGGGARGSYQIGACRALYEMGIEFGCVAGTSVGALNGAMIVQGDLEKAYELWCGIEPSKVIRFTDEEFKELGNPAFGGDNIRMMIGRIKKIVSERGLDVEPLTAMVTEAIDEDRIRKSEMDFGIVTVDITGKKPLEIYKEDIPEGRMADYLIASASFPGFKLKEIDGSLFIDGAVYNSLPVNLARDKGFRDIIVVRTLAIGRKRKINTEGLKITSIAPSESLGPILDFSSKRAIRNINLGYYDTLRLFKGLKGRKYYIKPLNDDNYFIKYFAGLSDEKIGKVCAIFGVETHSSKRVLFEHIIPKTADLLNVSPMASYEDISIALIESFAENCGVERFKIYEIRELVSVVSARFKPAKDDIKDIPRFLRRIDLISKIIKDKILSRIAQELFEGLRT